MVGELVEIGGDFWGLFPRGGDEGTEGTQGTLLQLIAQKILVACGRGAV